MRSALALEPPLLQSSGRPARGTLVPVGGASIPLGVEQRVQPGRHTLEVDDSRVEFDLAASETRTLTLAVAHGKCQPVALPKLASTSFGHTPNVANAECPSSMRGGVTTQPRFDPFAEGGTVKGYYRGACTAAYSSDWSLATFQRSACGEFAVVDVMTGIRFSRDPSGGCYALGGTFGALCTHVQAGNFGYLFNGWSARLDDGDRAYATTSAVQSRNGGQPLNRPGSPEAGPRRLQPLRRWSHGKTEPIVAARAECRVDGRRWPTSWGLRPSWPAGEAPSRPSSRARSRARASPLCRRRLRCWPWPCST